MQYYLLRDALHGQIISRSFASFSHSFTTPNINVYVDMQGFGILCCKEICLNPEFFKTLIWSCNFFHIRSIRKPIIFLFGLFLQRQNKTLWEALREQ